MKIKLRPGTTPRVVDWFRSLKEKPEEVRQVLTDQGILVESIFLERTTDADYLVLYQRAANLLQTNLTFFQSTHPLDAEMKQLITETWLEARPLELLMDLDLVRL